MKICYLCGRDFNDVDVLKHDEHIIQQAIGGTLIANDILCEKCGESLGEAIDVPFNKMFDSICTRLDIRRHRDSNKQRTAKGVICNNRDKYGNDLYGVEVFWKDGKVNPVQPFHKYTLDNSRVVIYAERKQLKNYIKKVKSEIGKIFPNSAVPEIIVCDDIDGLVNYALPLDDEHLKKGLAKIAIGFAAKTGVDRKNLNMVINSKLGRIEEKTPVIQFYPISIVDHIIENNKEEIRYFPSHTVILFTSAADTKILVCYIELFSTFQWYVILSDSYSGKPIYQGYTQRLDKIDDYIFNPGRKYYKERGIILSSLGITQDKINFAFEKQKNSPEAKTIEEIEYQIVQKEYTNQKYQIDFDEEIESYIEYVSNKSIQMMRSKSLSLNVALDMKKNIDLFYKNPSGEHHIFNVSNYRRIYIHKEKLNDYIISIIESKNTKNWHEKIKTYCHFKLYMLSKYIQKKNMTDKQKDSKIS